jgi:hypothetical protein
MTNNPHVTLMPPGAQHDNADGDEVDTVAKRVSESDENERVIRSKNV